MTFAPKANMPIGIEDFKELIERGYFFADKSKFIADILATGSKAILITRPRRFGKTLNLSMLRYFLDISNAAHHRRLFQKLEINQYQEAMREMGQHPVLMISLKSMKADSFEELIDAFKTLMSRIYSQHMYLIDALDAVDLKFFNHVRERKLTSSQLAASLRDLITFIAQYYGRKVVVLIDEYDHPLLGAFHCGFEKTFQNFYRNFMGHAMKGNDSLHFAVITGVMQMAGSGLFSDFNNVDMFTLLDENYAEAFGFTENDVRLLMRTVNKTEKLKEIKQWYNGYLFGKNQHIMYNPWSVLTYVARNFEPDAYWAHTSDNQLLQKKLYNVSEDTRVKFLSLMAADGSVQTLLPRRLRFSEVGVGKETSLWVLLLSSGYLKADIHPKISGPLLQAALSIPNEEVRFIYHHLFHGWLTKELGITDNSNTLIKYLTNGQVKDFCLLFQSHFQSSVSVHDVKSNTCEAFFHRYVLGLLAMINQTHIGHLRSNTESGFGRFDITLEPIDVEHTPGIVFELKYLQSNGIKRKSENEIEQQLHAASQKGLLQIKDKKYAIDLMARGVKKLAYISMAFSGKQMAFAHVDPFDVKQ